MNSQRQPNEYFADRDEIIRALETDPELFHAGRGAETATDEASGIPASEDNGESASRENLTWAQSTWEFLYEMRVPLGLMGIVVLWKIVKTIYEYLPLLIFSIMNLFNTADEDRQPVETTRTEIAAELPAENQDGQEVMPVIDIPFVENAIDEISDPLEASAVEEFDADADFESGQAALEEAFDPDADFERTQAAMGAFMLPAGLYDFTCDSFLGYRGRMRLNVDGNAVTGTLFLQSGRDLLDYPLRGSIRPNGGTAWLNVNISGFMFNGVNIPDLSLSADVYSDGDRYQIIGNLTGRSITNGFVEMNCPLDH